VVSDSAHTVLDYRRLQIGVQDIVWDSTRLFFYAVTRADSLLAPNSLVTIDPATNTVQSRALSSEPSCIAMSANGTYVYVGFKSGGTILRLLATGLVPDLTFPVGTAQSRIWQIVPSPVAPHTIAVRIDNQETLLTQLVGVIVVDDNVVRPATAHGSVNLPGPFYLANLDFADIDWTADAARIYGVLRSNPGVVDLPVDSQGVTLTRYRSWPLQGPITLDGDSVLSNDGRIFSLTGAIEQVGQMADSSGTHVWAKDRGKVFSLTAHVQEGAVLDGMTISSLDPAHYTLIDTITFNGAALVDISNSALLPWGTDGLAFMDQNELIIAHGTFAAAGTPAQPSNGLLVTTNTSLSSGISYRVLDVGARDVATNSCGQLLLSTSGGSWTRPNSVIQVNVADATVGRSVFAGSEPFLLAASDDCTMVYAGRQYSNSVARIRLSDFSVTDELPLQRGTAIQGVVARARSMDVAPRQPQTVAIARANMGVGLCDGTDAGMEIFDGAVPRPVIYSNGSSADIKSVVWGANSNVLYGEDWLNVYAFNVDSSGINSPRALMPYRVGTAVYDLGLDLHFDAAFNRIYDSFGHIYDVTAGTERGPLALVDNAAIVNSCGTPAQTVVTDSTSGKIFWINWIRNGQIAITTYARDTLANTGRVVLSGPDSMGLPLRAVRPSSNSLAIVTVGGAVVIAQGSFLDP
jgi:hypothetical protein